MRVVKSPKVLQRLVTEARQGRRRIALVPTMGYLHEGHLGLVHEARRRTGPDGLVVVSIYVNPTQFAPTEDLARYPRDFKRDAALCRAAGVDIIFAPEDLYPGKSTVVSAPMWRRKTCRAAWRESVGQLIFAA